jgi:hypothetical protein
MRRGRRQNTIRTTTLKRVDHIDETQYVHSPSQRRTQKENETVIVRKMKTGEREREKKTTSLS